MQWLETQNFLMNTVVEQKVCGEDPLSAAQKAVAEILRLESLLSFFDANSDVSRINQAAGREAVRISGETMMILQAALSCSEASKGAFDITLAPTIDLWRRCGEKGSIPSQEAIEAALSASGYHNLELDTESCSAYLRKQGCMIDLGAIGKGYAADRCIEVYKSFGVRSAFVNLGGNVKTIGTSPAGKPWSIGIQHPDKPRGVFFGALESIDQSVVTSGAYERYFEAGGCKYHHIIDALTGQPSTSGLKSVTVVCPHSMLADCLSTAAFVMGLHEGLSLIRDHNEAGALFVTENNSIYLTKNLISQFKLQPNSGLDCYVVE